MSHRSALLLLVLCALFWSSGGVLIKSIELHPLAIAGSRGLVAAVFIILIRRKLDFSWSKAQLCAVACFAYTTLGFVAATKMTTAANAILLQFTAPIYVAILSGPLLGERVSRRDISTLGIVLIGMSLFFIEKLSSQNMLGNILALTTGFSFAGLALSLRMQQGKSTFESIFLGLMLTAIIGLPFLSQVPASSDILKLFTLGVFQLGTPYLLYSIIVRHVSALEAAMVPMIEPILNPLWVAVFVGEIPSVHSSIGGGIVILALAVNSILMIYQLPARSCDQGPTK